MLGRRGRHVLPPTPALAKGLQALLGNILKLSEGSEEARELNRFTSEGW